MTAHAGCTAGGANRPLALTLLMPRIVADDEYDAAMLGYLVDSLLLEKRVPFPVPEGLPEAALNGFYQHHIVGRAYSRAGVQTKASLLERLRRFIGKS